MSKYIKKFSIPVAAAIVAAFVFPELVHIASAQTGLGGEFARPEVIGAATGNEVSLIALTRKLLNYFLGFLGILCVAMIIYGGFMYVTAGVNEQGAETGKKVLLYAAIGVVVILLSFVIVNALLASGSGVSPTG
jgi:hypothetical protein